MATAVLSSFCTIFGKRTCLIRNIRPFKMELRHYKIHGLEFAKKNNE